MTNYSNVFNDLFKIYEQINMKNGEKIDLSGFKIDNEVSDGEKGVVYDFKEDVIDEIAEDLTELKNIVTELKTLNMDRNLNEINYEYIFRGNLAKLIGIYGNLSSEFSDLYDFHGKFIQSLPEGPQDDSELIQ